MHINGELENVFIERINSWNFPDFYASEAGRIWYHREAKQFMYNNGSAIVPLVDTGATGRVAGEQQITAVDSLTFEYRNDGGANYTEFWAHEAPADETSPETYTHVPTPWTFGKHLIIMNDHYSDPSSDSYELYIELPDYQEHEVVPRPPVEMGSFRITNKSNKVININVSSLENDGNVAFYASSRKINPGTTALFQLFFDSNNINDKEWQTYWAVIFEETAASGGSGASVTPLRNLVELSRRPNDDKDAAYAPRWWMPEYIYTPQDYDDPAERYLRFSVGGMDSSDLPMLALGLSNIADRIDSQTHFATTVDFTPDEYQLKSVLRGYQQALEFRFQIVLYDYTSPQDSQLLHSTQLVKLITTLPWTDEREPGDETPVVEPYEYAGTINVNVVLPEGLDYADPGRYALLVAVSTDETTLVETGYPALAPGYLVNGNLEFNTFFQERFIDPYSEKFKMPSVDDPDM